MVRLVDHPPAPDALLVEFLGHRDLPCPVCRFNLRDGVSAACPECGSPLELQIGSIDRRLGLWLCVFLAHVIPFGFAATLSTMATWVVISGRLTASQALTNIVILACIGGALVHGTFVGLIWFGRRRFWRLGRTAQRLGAGVGTLAAVIIFAVVVILILLK